MNDKHKEFFDKLVSLCKEYGVTEIHPRDPDDCIYFDFEDKDYEYSIPIACYENGIIYGVINAWEKEE